MGLIKKILDRKKFDRVIHACAGDTVNLVATYTDPVTGKEVVNDTLVSHTLTATRSFDEGVIAEIEFEDRTGIGGLFLDAKK
jgi:hypothetical protein